MLFYWGCVSTVTMYLRKIEKANNVKRAKAETILREEILQRGETFKHKHGISDIIDGVTNGRITGASSHSRTDPLYWMNKGRLERESFAHMYESSYNKKKAKAMSEYFPSAYKIFKKKLKGAI